MDGEHEAGELNLEKAAQLLARSGLMPGSAPGTPAYVQEVVDGLVELCAIDPQTGLGTRRRLETKLAHLRGLALRGLSVTVLAFSLEGLHQISAAPCDPGRLLRTAAGLIRAAIRDADVPGRLTGETFAVVLAGAPASEVRTISGRIQGFFANGYFGEGAAAPRLRFGATSFDATEAPAECIERALACLASARRSGCTCALQP